MVERIEDTFNDDSRNGWTTDRENVVNRLDRWHPGQIFGVSIQLLELRRELKKLVIGLCTIKITIV